MLPKPISLEPPRRGTPRPSPVSRLAHRRTLPRLPVWTPTVPLLPGGCGQNHISGLISLLQGLLLPFSPSVSFPPSPTALPPWIPPALPHLPPKTGSAAPRGGPVPAGRAICPSLTSPWTEAYPPILVALLLGLRAPWGLPSPGTSSGPKNSPFCRPPPATAPPPQPGCAVSLCSPDFWPHGPPRSHPGLPVSGLSLPLH